MNTIRRRLSYANVMSTIAVFLLLGGAAVAATQLPKNSVGTKQLKKNAVATAKIRKNAVTTAKIKARAVTEAKLADGAVTGGKLADGAVTETKLADGAVKSAKLADGSITEGKLADNAVTGAKIDASTTQFTRVVYRVGGSASVPFTTGQLYPLVNPNYTQPAGEVDQYIGGMEVAFAASCVAPRTVLAYLLMDAANPTAPTSADIIGYGLVEDKGAGAVTRQMGFTPLPGAGSPFRAASSSAIPHTFSILMTTATCTSGSGINAVGGTVDVLGTTGG